MSSYKSSHNECLSRRGVGNCVLLLLCSHGALLCASSRWSSSSCRLGFLVRADFLVLESPLLEVPVLGVGDRLDKGGGVDMLDALAAGGVEGFAGVRGRFGVKGLGEELGSPGPLALLLAASHNSSKLTPVCSQIAFATSQRYDT